MPYRIDQTDLLGRTYPGLTIYSKKEEAVRIATSLAKRNKHQKFKVVSCKNKS